MFFFAEIFFHSFSSPDRGLDGNRYWSKPTIEEYRKSTEPHGMKGNATLGTAHKGERIFKAIVANTIEAIREIENVKIDKVNKTPPI